MPQSVVIKDSGGDVVLDVNSDGSLNAKMLDKNSISTEFDTVGSSTPGTYGYLVAIDLPHHKIHEGVHYFCSDYDNDVDTGTPKLWRLTTPAAGFVHLTFKAQTTLNGLLELYENATISAAGTTLPSYNSDRSSANTSTVVHAKDTTTSAAGTLIRSYVMGSDGANPVGADGGEASHDNEMILKASEDYVFKFTAGTDNARITLNLEYYIVPTT